MKTQIFFVTITLLVSTQALAGTQSKAKSATSAGSKIISNMSEVKPEKVKPLVIDFTEEPFYMMPYVEYNGLTQDQKDAYYTSASKHIAQLKTSLNFPKNKVPSKVEFQSIAEDEQQWKDYRTQIYTACLDKGLKDLNKAACQNLATDREKVLDNEGLTQGDVNRDSDAAKYDQIDKDAAESFNGVQ